MKRLLFLCVLVLMMFGCPTIQYVHNVPDLAEVEPGLWRSGQPINDDDWKYLHDVLHINHVIKLNFEHEGPDEGAIRAGMIVHVLGIQPEGDVNIWDDVFHSFLRPSNDNIIEAERTIWFGGGVLVHCTHGHDRTGLVIGIHRVIHEDWTKAAAYNEMLKYGFHPELHGLHEYWEDVDGAP